MADKEKKNRAKIKVRLVAVNSKIAEKIHYKYFDKIPPPPKKMADKEKKNPPTFKLGWWR